MSQSQTWTRPRRSSVQLNARRSQPAAGKAEGVAAKEESGSNRRNEGRVDTNGAMSHLKAAGERGTREEGGMKAGGGGPRFILWLLVN